MELPTIQQIQNMSDEEVHELNVKLGKRALKNLLLYHGIKWALIFGLTYGARKLLEPKA